MTRQVWWRFLSVLLSWPVVFSCTSQPKTDAAGRLADDMEIPKLRVTDQSEHLLFTYLVADGTFQTVDRVADVPAEARGRVIVLDTSLSPEERQSSRLIYVADLTAPRPDGSYSCRPVSRFRFERDLMREPSVSGAMPEDCRGLGPSPDDRVILYATAWCSVCKAAERFLDESKIPFQKKDIEADRSAERELTCKALRTGTRVEGVPVLDVGGRLLVGFDRDEILRLAGKLKIPAEKK